MTAYAFLLSKWPRAMQGSRVAVTRVATQCLALAVLWSGGCSMAAAQQVAATEAIDGRRAAVLVFLPHEMSVSRTEDDWLARMFAQSIVESVRRCLPERADVRVSYADRVVIRQLPADDTIELRQAVPLPGALLFRPGNQPRVLYAGGGATALIPLVLPGIGDYFGGPSCDL